MERSFDLDHLKEVDLKSFLKSEKEACLMSVIEETKTQTLKETEDLFAATDELEWENEKQKILQELLGSFNPEPTASLHTTSAMHSRTMNNSSFMSATSTTPNAQNRTIMSEIEMEFSKG